MGITTFKSGDTLVKRQIPKSTFNNNKKRYTQRKNDQSYFQKPAKLEALPNSTLLNNKRTYVQNKNFKISSQIPISTTLLLNSAFSDLNGKYALNEKKEVFSQVQTPVMLVPVKTKDDTEKESKNDAKTPTLNNNVAKINTYKNPFEMYLPQNLFDENNKMIKQLKKKKKNPKGHMFALQEMEKLLDGKSDEELFDIISPNSKKYGSFIIQNEITKLVGKNNIDGLTSLLYKRMNSNFYQGLKMNTSKLKLSSNFDHYLSENQEIFDANNVKISRYENRGKKAPNFEKSLNKLEESLKTNNPDGIITALRPYCKNENSQEIRTKMLERLGEETYKSLFIDAANSIYRISEVQKLSKVPNTNVEDDDQPQKNRFFSLGKLTENIKKFYTSIKNKIKPQNTSSTEYKADTRLSSTGRTQDIDNQTYHCTSADTNFEIKNGYCKAQNLTMSDYAYEAIQPLMTPEVRRHINSNGCGNACKTLRKPYIIKNT